MQKYFVKGLFETSGKMTGAMDEPGYSKRRSLVDDEEKFDFDVHDEANDDRDIEQCFEEEEDDDEHVNFKPPSPGPPIIDLRGREVIFAIAVFFLLSVTIGLIVVLGTTKKFDKGQSVSDNGQPAANKMCVTKECLYAAAYMLDNMNLSVDPCEDFWSYSCGGWLHRHTIPSSRTSWSVDAEIEKRLNKYVRDLIDVPVERDMPDSAERKVKTMYNKCMDIDAVDDAGAGPLIKIIDSFGGWALQGKLTYTQLFFGKLYKDMGTL